MPSPVLLLLIGGATAFLAGMLGAGGGLATVTLLLAIGMDAHHVVGTTLVFTAAIGAAGSYVHHRQGTGDARLALALGIPSIATAQVGAQIAESLGDRTLTFMFAGLTVLVTVMMLAKRERAPVPISGAQHDLRFRAPAPLLAGAAVGGAVIGLAQGLLGVGGGFLLVPFMILVLKVPEHITVGSSLFAILIGSLSGSVRHAMLGNVEVDVLVFLIPAGLIGTVLGTRMVRRLTPAAVRRAFVAMMLTAATYLVFRAI